jgi:phi LC3 family holin
MLTIDLKARMRNKAFWVALISAIVLLIQQLGLKDLIPNNYGDIVNSVLTILVMLGIIVDTSTSGISDKKVTLNANIDSKALLQENADLKAKLEQINNTLNPIKE